MFGPVPIPTAVVPMLRHYTNLYETSRNPTVNIHAFPFEFNEFMTTRVDTIQGNRWWEPLLGEWALHISFLQLSYVIPCRRIRCTGSTSKSGPSDIVHVKATNVSIAQPMQPQFSGLAYPIDENAQPPTAQIQPTQGLDAPQPPKMSTSSLDGAVPMEPPSNAPPTNISATAPAQVTQVAPVPPSNPVLVTSAAPKTPYFAVNATISSEHPTTAYAQRPGGPRFIPYNPPGGPTPASEDSASAPPAVPRQAIIAPPVKNPRPRRRSIKTSEFIDEDGKTPNGSASVAQGPGANSPTEEGPHAEKENGISANGNQSTVKRSQDNIKIDDYSKPHVRTRTVIFPVLSDILWVGRSRGMHKLCKTWT